MGIITNYTVVQCSSPVITITKHIFQIFKQNVSLYISTRYCRTPVLGLGLGVDFTLDWNNKNKKNMNNNNNNKNPHLIIPNFKSTWEHLEQI